jgi:hypothetical protein
MLGFTPVGFCKSGERQQGKDIKSRQLSLTVLHTESIRLLSAQNYMSTSVNVSFLYLGNNLGPILAKHVCLRG